LAKQITTKTDLSGRINEMVKLYNTDCLVIRFYKYEVSEISIKSYQLIFQYHIIK